MAFKDIKLPSNKKFALFFSLVFSIIGLYLFYKGLSRYGSLSLVVASLFLCIAFIKPALVSPLNKAWMFIGFAMGKIISPLILGGIFFLLITPLALILKISGITKHVAYLIGKYILIYPEKEDLGFFTLTFVKSNNEWLILSDHTSKISNPK